MAEAKLRVLWVCGAAGAGKSVAAWGLSESLTRAGAAVAYVDIDQLGMLYPATELDRDRYALKSAALDALVNGYAAAGASTLIVSGVVDSVSGPALEADVELTLCLLSPDPGVLRSRLLARGWEKSDADEAAREDATLRAASFVDTTIETGGLSIAQTVARLERFAGDVRQSAAVPGFVVVESSAPAEVIVVTGPRAVGTSTVGFGLAMRAWRARQRVGFVDLRQLGFLSGRDGRLGSDTTLAIGQLATMHRILAQRGAERLVVSAQLTPADRHEFRAAFPCAPVTIVRLRGDAEAFADHVRERARGNAVRLAADDLLDADESYQALIVKRALAEQEALDHFAVDDAVFDISRRTPAEVIADVATSRNQWADPPS